MSEIPVSESKLRRWIRRGANAHQMGDLSQAEKIYGEIIEICPDYPDALHYLALVYADKGDFDAALQSIASAEKSKPDDARILSNHARILVNMNVNDEAEKKIRRAFELEPQDVQIYLQYASLMLEIGLADEILNSIDSRLESAEGIYRYKLLLLAMSAYIQSGRRVEALRYVLEASRINKTDAEAFLQLYECYVQLNDTDSAKRALLSAVKMESNSPDVVLALAGESAVNGKFTISRHLARRALKLSAYGKYPAWLLLSGTLSENEAEKLKLELDRAPRPEPLDPEGYGYYFALGRVLEYLGDYKEAFTAYKSANAIQARAGNYDKDAREKWTNSMIAGVTGNLIRRIQALVPKECVEAPIFICGMPRSGTTLAESVIAKHPEVCQGGELLFIHDALRRHLGCRNITDLGTALSSLDDDQLSRMAKELHSEYGERRDEYTLLTDKMPSHSEIAGILTAFFPNSKIIHMNRNPLDNCLSCFITPFSSDNVFSNSMDHIGHYYSTYVRLMENWRKTLNADVFQEFSYEEFVFDIDSASRRLYEICGLKWTPEVMEYYDTNSEVRTSSFYQVRKPVYTTSVDKVEKFPEFHEFMKSNYSDIF